MSDYESHSGRLIPIEREENESDKNYCKRALGDKFKEEYWNDEDILDFIYDADLYQEVFYVNHKIYLNADHKELDPYDSKCELVKNEDGSYSYFTTFYNGGTDLNEMIEEGLLKIKEHE